MVGGIRYEFTHRVIATCIGILTIGLATWLWKAEKRQWMRWLGLVALGGVIAQGILGGATVLTFQMPAVSAAHATLAQLFFSTVVSIAVFTSAWWSRDQIEADDPGSPRGRTLIVWTLAAVFLQLILGAAFRHKGFGIIPHLIGAVIVIILIFMTAGALKKRFAGRSCVAQKRPVLAHPDWRAAIAGRGSVLVAPVCIAFSAANCGYGGVYSGTYRDRCFGAGRHARDSINQLSYDQSGESGCGIRDGFAADCPIRPF